MAVIDRWFHKSRIPLLIMGLLLISTVNSLYSGYCRDLKLVSSAVRIIGVSVIAGCPQGES